MMQAELLSLERCLARLLLKFNVFVNLKDINNWKDIFVDKVLPLSLELKHFSQYYTKGSILPREDLLNILKDLHKLWCKFNAMKLTEEESDSKKLMDLPLQNIFSEYGPPLGWSYFLEEGDVYCSAVLVVPPNSYHNLYKSYCSSTSSVKLFLGVECMPIEFEKLLPKYLNFLRGVIVSSTLPLDVSREMPEVKSLSILKEILTCKALDMINKIAEEDIDNVKRDDEKSACQGQYARFWNEFGTFIKLGIIRDKTNLNSLAKLLRFKSTKSDGRLTSLEQYVSRMMAGQKQILFTTKSSNEKSAKPLLLKKFEMNLEVMLEIQTHH